MNDLERYQRDRASVMSMLKFILMVVIIVACAYVGKIIAVILVPFLIGFLLAKTSDLIAKPLAKHFDNNPKKIKAGRKKSTHTKTALVIYVILDIFVVIFIIITCVGLVYQANSLLIALAEATKTFKPTEILDTQIFQRFSVENGGFLTEEMMISLREDVANMGQTVVKNIPSLISSSLSTVWKLVGNLPYAVFFVISILLSGFYFISDGPQVLKIFVKNTPNRKFRNRVFTLLNDLSVLVFRVLGGYLVLFIITAVESFLVFWIAGLHEYAIVLSIITALIDFLPVLGVSATMIPMMIYQVMHGQYVSAIVIIIGLILMTIIRRFVEPAILGKSLKMHPIVTLIAMAAGVYIWGAAGFLLGPVLAIIIIQAIKVFEIDKMAGKYFSGILDRLMVNKDVKEKKAAKEAVKEELEAEDELGAEDIESKDDTDSEETPESEDDNGLKED